MCGSRKCPNYPHIRDWKFLVVGSQRPKPFKEMYEAQLEFLGGEGLMKNLFCGIGRDNLWNYTLRRGTECF